MLVVESSMAGGRKEVALAAIAVITTVMQAHGTTKAVSRRYLHTPFVWYQRFPYILFFLFELSQPPRKQSVGLLLALTSLLRTLYT